MNQQKIGEFIRDKRGIAQLVEDLKDYEER